MDQHGSDVKSKASAAHTAAEASTCESARSMQRISMSFSARRSAGQLTEQHCQRPQESPQPQGAEDHLGVSAPGHMDPRHRHGDATDAQPADPYQGFAQPHGSSDSPHGREESTDAQTDSDGRQSQVDIIGE